MDDVLVAEISGRRPGASIDARPTELVPWPCDRVIVSNDSAGYGTDWEVIDVPEDFRRWYEGRHRIAEGGAWLAPMNRSYAVMHAREMGYRYLVQVDDNIKALDCAFRVDLGDGAERRYLRMARFSAALGGWSPEGAMAGDFVRVMRTVLQETDAALCGLGMAGTGPAEDRLLAERYCYSFFMLDLRRCPSVFQGDFEDDIEYRLKCREMGRPTVMLPMFRYSKTSQFRRGGGDESGNRAEYTKAGVGRGDHMRMIHGDVYGCGLSHKGNGNRRRQSEDEVFFRHRLKPFKLGVTVRDRARIEDEVLGVLAKWAPPPRPASLRAKGPGA